MNLLSRTWFCLALALVPQLPPAAGGEMESGQIAVYGDAFQGRPTASGELYEPGLLTAAHASLPIGTFVRVANLESGRMIDVRINDRKARDERIIHLSHRAADEIGLGRGASASGTIMVIPARPAITPPPSTSGAPSGLFAGLSGDRPAQAKEDRGFDPLAMFRSKREEPAAVASPASSSAPPFQVNPGTVAHDPSRIAPPPLPPGAAAPKPAATAPPASANPASHAPEWRVLSAATPEAAGGTGFSASTFSGDVPYRVQFGAFRRAANAHEFSAALVESGVTTTVVPSNVNGLHLVITQFGFPTAEEAQRWIDYEGARRGWRERPSVVR